MKDAQNTPTANIPKHQAQWPVFQIHHQRSRYIYELYYEKEAISRELYDWLLKNGHADAKLIAKWKKQGYEKVCDIWALAFPFTEVQRILMLCLVVLPQMRTDQGDQLQLDVYMSRAQSTDEGRDERGAVCQLRLQRLCFKRLKRDLEVQQVTTFRILRALATGRRLGGKALF